MLTDHDSGFIYLHIILLKKTSKNQREEILLKWICRSVYRFVFFLWIYSVNEASSTWECLMTHWFHLWSLGRHDIVFLKLHHQRLFHNYFSSKSRSISVHRSLRPSTQFSNSRRFPSMIPFQPLLHTFHVVTHGSWPTFVNNLSVLDDVKADGKSTVSDVCCVKHRIYHHGTSGNFSRHLTCCTTSFGLRSVGSDFVVVLWKDVKSNLMKALKSFAVSPECMVWDESIQR